MRLSKLLGLSSIFLSLSSASLYPRDHDARDYIAVHLRRSISPDRVAQLLGGRHEGQIGELEDHHTFSFPKGRGEELDSLLDEIRLRRRRKRHLEVDGDGGALDTRDEGDELDGILYSEKLVLKQRLHKRVPPPPPSWVKSKKTRHVRAKDTAVTRQREITRRLSIQDPIFVNQWHLFNTEQPGHDLNVTGLWLEGITGNGTITAIVDDGLDMYSHDLKDNYYAEGSFDFNDKGKEPRPRLVDDKHGTRCAGEVAAVKNDICGVGVAYTGKVSGIRILSKPVTDEDEAAAINYGYQKNQIFSCSWGPVDNGATMDAPGLLIRRAMVNGIQKGRGGKGSIFVFAAGNGAASEDNCNFDGYTNSIYSVTVGAIDRDDEHPYYSESCSAQLVVTYSSGGSHEAISTTDVGLDTCYNRHGGTSAAGPLVVGVVALALSVRPELTWRDIQYLIVETAIPINTDKPGWQETAIGKQFSHDFGYGKVDAYSVVQLAKTWKLVKPQAWFHSPWLKVHTDVPQGDKGLVSAFEITEQMLKKENLERVEHVTVTMNVQHTRRGDLSVELHSPSGVVSYLSTTRSNDLDQRGYVDWTFMSVAHWGETGVGNWTVIVKDTQVNEFSGRFLDWQLSLWGEAIDGKIQKLHPLPDVHDHDHDTSESASLVATTTISTASTSKTAAPEKPTNHVDRPINAKPTSPTGTAGAAAATSSANSTSIPITDNLLPSPFPSFGVSKVTQIWIYGSVALIFIFCVALGIYFVVQRRKRLRNTPRDDYEFEMVAEDEEGYPLSGAGAGGIVGGRKQSQRRRRGGELYDAFAGESDEEIFSESEAGEKPYYDHEDGDDDDEGRADGVDGQQRTRDDGQAVWSEKSRGSGEPGTGS